MTKANPQASTTFLLPLYDSAILEKPLLHANCPGCNICTVGLVFFLWSLAFGEWPGQLKRTKQLRNTISQKSWQKVSAVLPGSSQAGRLQQMQREPGKPASSLLSAPQRHSWAPPGLSARSPNPTWHLESSQWKLPVFPAKAPSSMNEDAGGSEDGQLLPAITMSGRSLTSPPGEEEGRKSLAPCAVNALLRRQL